MKLKTVNISKLKPHSKNPNTHPVEQLSELQSSLEQFDQVKNIVVWQDKVIAGCGLLEAAEKQGRSQIEVQDVSDWPEEKAIKFMISDNRLAEIAIMDDDILAGLLKDLGDPLDVPGIDATFLESLSDNVTPDAISINDDSETNDLDDEKNIIIRIEIDQKIWASERDKIIFSIEDIRLKNKKYLKYQIRE